LSHDGGSGHGIDQLRHDRRVREIAQAVSDSAGRGFHFHVAQRAVPPAGRAVARELDGHAQRDGFYSGYRIVHGTLSPHTVGMIRRAGTSPPSQLAGQGMAMYWSK